ncbi:MAG: hypothetical protein Ta2G_11230 [Termitinemataceae bacterium]|nr:MAG: hypothetical protein Ta2G_11230 [Termitinemataceae bacterium]
MVKKVILFFISAFLLSCEVDIAGIFGSTDLNDRLEDTDTFNFIKPEWKKLSFGDNYEFIVISDIHIIGRNAHGLENLKDHIGRAKFVVLTGDITQSGTQEEVNRFVEIAGTLGVPCFPVIGNHDIYFGNYHDVWRKTIGSTRYRIDADTTTLLVMDTANAFVGKAQFNWLKAQLRTAKPAAFVFTHANFFTDGASTPNQQGLTNRVERAQLVSLLAGSSKAHISGHIHKRIINKVNGTHFLTLEDFKTTQNYCRISVNKENVSWVFESL